MLYLHRVTEGIGHPQLPCVIAERSGELRLDQLATVLDPRRYPPDRQLILFDLMRKFDLCFAYPDGGRLAGALDLLQAAARRSGAAVRAGPPAVRVLGYPIVPEGLIRGSSCAAARSPRHSPRSRNGVVLRFEGSYVVVKVLTSRSAVEIDVGGYVRRDGDCWPSIRSDFEALHRSYRVPICAMS